jgi:multiple sugar transport system substrate-binding protein
MKGNVMKTLAAVALIAFFAAFLGTAYPGQPIRVIASTHSFTDSMQRLLSEFERETGVKAELDVYGDEQASQKMLVELTAQSDAMDVFMIRPLQDQRMFHRNGWMEDLTPYFRDDADYDFEDFNEAARNATNISGFQCTIPAQAECEVLFYRKDLFEAKGLTPPETFEELEKAARILTDRKNDMYGFVSRGARSALITMFSSFLYGFGADWVDEKGNSAVHTPPFLAAIDLYARLLREYGPPGAPNISWAQSVAIFGQGKAAMYTDVSTTFPNILDRTKSAVADKTGVMLFPAGPAGRRISYIVPMGLGISKFSRNKEAAWKYIRFMTNKKNSLRIQGEWANATSRISAYQVPEGIAAFPKDFAKAISEAGKYGVDHDRPQVVAVQEARDHIGEAVVAAIEGKDYVPAAKIASQRFQAIIDRERTGAKP